MGTDERAIVENRLLRAQQLVFDKNPDWSRMEAVKQFTERFNETPNFDNPEHIQLLSKYAKEITSKIRKGGN